ncbi:hypothetical protein CAL12_04220 [Bordetella genomosp. 8]|uniref:ABC3 transporter permease C-terminal domain-containing protein n=1 Tax=Bordetella genomosp. 8 TaxID=1416806 RepID=A0A1W6YGG7_9BORD|nr:FtsX-like permease family protein [Bordetella genomosp. 8]ARP80108.1 hypothetical protein CAL12_04220 [Bordetella genomosp. 8]
MALPISTNFALRQLGHKDLGLVAALAGVCVAVVLVFVQVGFRNALTDSVLNFDRALDADIVLSSSQFETIAHTPPWFARGLVYQARDVAGVRSATPVYVRMARLSMTPHGEPLSARVIGVDPADAALHAPGLAQQQKRLRQPAAGLIDALSRGPFADRVEQVNDGAIPRVYLRNARGPGNVVDGQRQGRAPTGNGIAAPLYIDLIGTFQLGPDFNFPGSLIVSDQDFSRLFDHPADRVTLGLVKIVPGANAERVRDELGRRMRGSAQVWLKEDFIAAERNHFIHRTPLGIVTNFGILVGIMIGVVFVLEVLHGIIEKNLAEYAVLRAAGRDHGLLLALVIQLALFVAVATFAASLAVTALLYKVLERATQLTFSMDASVAASVLLATLTMSALAVVLAMRKLLQSDPVDSFA